MRSGEFSPEKSRRDFQDTLGIKARGRSLTYGTLSAGFFIFQFKLFFWKASLILIGIDLCYLAENYLLFRFGLKRYESGNLIETKL